MVSCKKYINHYCKNSSRLSTLILAITPETVSTKSQYKKIGERKNTIANSSKFIVECKL